MEPTITQLRLRLETAACGVAPVSSLLVCGLVERFEDHAAQHYPMRAGTSELDNFMDALQPVLLLYADMRAEDFGPIQLQACRQYMIEQNLARSTINARVRRIRQVFKYGVSKGWIPSSVLSALQSVSGLQRGRTAAKEPEPVTPVPIWVIQATLAQARPQIRDMSNLQLLTGCRPGELCAMRGCDITCDGPVWLYKPASHKTQHHGHKRIIPIGPKGIAIVEKYLRPSYLFPSKSGGPFRVTSYETAIRRAAERAKVSHWGPNRLRHNAATLMREQFGLDTAQAVLGHARIETTQVYSERMNHLAAQAALKVG